MSENNVKNIIVPEENNEIQGLSRFLSVFGITTTIHSGVRTEGSAIKTPVELLNKSFKITDIYISAISSTLEALGAGDNLLVGLIISGKSILLGASQTFNGITTTLDMLPVPLILYEPTLKICSRRARYSFLSELFTNVNDDIKIVYSHKSTATVHYLVYLTIAGVILSVLT